MARIAGVELKDNLKVDYALTTLKGVGWPRSREIMEGAGIDKKARVKDLTASDISRISAKLEDFLIEGDLLRKVREDIQRLKVIGAYRGMRHAKGLPVRGQRTRSNARTKRGKRRTVGAYKKEMLSKMVSGKAEGEKK